MYSPLMWHSYELNDKVIGLGMPLRRFEHSADLYRMGLSISE